MSGTNIDTGLTTGRNSFHLPICFLWICFVKLLQSFDGAPTADEETKQRRIMSKLCDKGNKWSHKVRELDKCPMLNSSDASTHHDTETEPSPLDCQNNHQSRSSADESSNTISTNKPFAVVKPIIRVKSGLIVAQTSTQVRAESEANSSTVAQADQINNTTTSWVVIIDPHWGKFE